MITNSLINYRKPAGEVGDSSLGNMLFKIAGPIGIATKNGYTYGFPEWVNQDLFVNELPRNNRKLRRVKVPGVDIEGMNIDFGFKGFEYPDDIDINGEFGSYKYFSHCEDLIRHYFTLKPQCEPIKDTILMHYRNYNNPAWVDLKGYYKEALKKLPNKPVLVVTDNIDNAYKAIGLNCEYTSNSPIVDFYLLANADYLVMANSTFSWWGAWLSKAMTVAPLDWYDGVLKNAPKDDLYLPQWILV